MPRQILETALLLWAVTTVTINFFEDIESNLAKGLLVLLWMLAAGVSIVEAIYLIWS